MNDKTNISKKRIIIERLIDEMLYIAGISVVSYGICGFNNNAGIIFAGIGIIVYGMVIRRPII